MHAMVAADLHGNSCLYELLLRIAGTWKISSVFLTGDLFPRGEPGRWDEDGADLASAQRTFIRRTFIPLFESFLAAHRHTHIYAIMGNDDCRANEPMLSDFDSATQGFHLVNARLVELQDSRQMHAFFPGEIPRLYVTGYPFVPPGSGLLFDWVKYENPARLRPPGMDSCIDIYEAGMYTGKPSATTIADDLEDYGAFLRRECEEDGPTYIPEQTIHIFHAPPYGTPLDRMPPQGRYELLRLPDHVGSSEIARFIERTQPYLVLSGHCHESVVLGSYKAQIGNTWCVNPGSQADIDVLSIVQFDIYDPGEMKQLFVNAR